MRVKDGEIAVFVYKSGQDFILGPYDDTIKTANFPILSSIVGLAFGGGTPFQAEIYFINLAGNIQIKFGVPYFDVFDPRFLDFPVPLAVRGTFTFNINDYHEFIKLNRMINFELEDLKKQTMDAVKKYVKGVVTNIPSDNGIPVLQIERKILEINDIVTNHLKPRLFTDFGINVKEVDIGVIDIDKESDGYMKLRKMTSEVEEAMRDTRVKAIEAQGNVQEKLAEGMTDAAILGATMSAKSQNIGVYQLDKHAEVGVAAAESLGSMGAMNIGGGGSGDGGGMGFNPVGMMVGMGVGGAIGQSMGGMVGNVMNPINQQMQQQTSNQQVPPPPPPAVMYNISINGNQAGPFTIEQLKQMAQGGQFTKQYYVWKQGMANWELAENIAEISIVFTTIPPPPPM